MPLMMGRQGKVRTGEVVPISETASNVQHVLPNEVTHHPHQARDHNRSAERSLGGVAIGAPKGTHLSRPVRPRVRLECPENRTKGSFNGQRLGATSAPIERHDPSWGTRPEKAPSMLSDDKGTILRDCQREEDTKVASSETRPVSQRWQKSEHFSLYRIWKRGHIVNMAVHIFLAGITKSNDVNT
jgi:hypothetical protein